FVGGGQTYLWCRLGVCPPLGQRPGSVGVCRYGRTGDYPSAGVCGDRAGPGVAYSLFSASSSAYALWHVSPAGLFHWVWRDGERGQTTHRGTEQGGRDALEYA